MDQTVPTHRSIWIYTDHTVLTKSLLEASINYVTFVNNEDIADAQVDLDIYTVHTVLTKSC